MRNTHCLVDDWALRVFAIEKARDIFETSGETFYEIYDTLTDDQKIAFILAGGMPSLFRRLHRGIDADRETGQLPVLC